MKIYLLPRDQRERRMIIILKSEQQKRKKNSGMEYSLTIDYPVSL